jgi:hemin uptake protein HemP
MNDSRDVSGEGALPSQGSASALRTYSTSELFGQSREIGIAHEGAIYRLRITRMGKLILTK